jgi:N-acetylglucosamine-6-phosphate deacetylase
MRLRAQSGVLDRPGTAPQRSRMINAGLVDLQVNGYAGVDFNDAALTPAALDHALAAMWHDGVTSCLPTLITAAPEALIARLQALDAAVTASHHGPRMVPGYHLEGPFLNAQPGYAGCHPPEAMSPPDIALLQRLDATTTRPILLITLAPELAGSDAVIRWARAAHKLVAIGHSAADHPTVTAAASAGASLSTHLGNGLPQQLPKLANTLFAQLAEDRLTACVIADGIHLPPHALGVMLRAKTPSRAILVTDATAAAAAPAGRYAFAGMAITRDADGRVQAAGGTTLAGSSLRLDAAVRNLVTWGIATPAEAMAMASDTPRALLAPILRAHDIRLPHAAVHWSETLRPTSVQPLSAPAPLC